jgi:hypothetical protein
MRFSLYFRFPGSGLFSGFNQAPVTAPASDRDILLHFFFPCLTVLAFLTATPAPGFSLMIRLTSIERSMPKKSGD